MLKIFMSVALAATLSAVAFADGAVSLGGVALDVDPQAIAEVPPCGSERYVIDTPAFGGFSFDGWLDALRRYNGRRDRTETDRYYSDEYADKIVKRANDTNAFVPIEIKLAK